MEKPLLCLWERTAELRFGNSFFPAAVSRDFWMAPKTQRQQGVRSDCLKDNPSPVGVPRKGLTSLGLCWELLLLNHRSPGSSLAKSHSGSPRRESQHWMRGSAHLINYITMPALYLLTHSHKSPGCAAYVVSWLKGECMSTYGCVQ